jgi:hypothetical protein
MTPKAHNRRMRMAQLRRMRAWTLKKVRAQGTEQDSRNDM